VMFVLFTDFVNNTVLPVVDKVNNEKCAMQHHSDTACGPRGICVKYFWANAR